MQKSSTRAGVANGSNEICGRTVSRQFKKFNLKCVKPQRKTQARIRNEYDMRNSYTMIAMVYAFAEFLDPNMLFNWDATQFAIERDGVTDVLVLKSEVDCIPPTVKSSGETGIAIKYIHFHNSAGDIAPAVYLIADDSLSANEIVCQSIPGLGNGTELGSLGWLCMCKTRQANCEFYKWFAQTIVVPFVRDSRRICDSKNPDGSDMRAFVTCDGEEAQIRVFQEDCMLALFRDALIDFGKTPASCSAICQSSDVSSFFKAMKTSVSNVQDQLWQNASLAKKIKAFFTSRATCGISAVNKSKLVDGLQKITFCMQKVLNKGIIKNGYVRCGQDAPIGLDCDGKPTMEKFHAQMRLCKADITEGEMKILIDKFPDMVAIMRARGTVTEAEMDALNIPSVNHLDADQKPKDQRALHKQRAVIMNTVDCISKYKTYTQHSRILASKRVLAAGTSARKRKATEVTVEFAKMDSVGKRRASVATREELTSSDSDCPDEISDENDSDYGESNRNPYYKRFETSEFTI